MSKIRMLAVAIVLATLPRTAHLQEIQENVRGCTLIDDADARLTCFDAAFVPVSDDMAPLTPAIVGSLLVEFGDPEFAPDNVEYRIAQNGYLVRELLVGTWSTLSWDILLGFYRAGRLPMACQPPAPVVTITPDDSDPFTLNATRKQGDSVSPAFALTWRGGNGFIRVDNIGAHMERIDVTLDDRFSWGSVGVMLGQNGAAWTITPRSPDVMVATSPSPLHAGPTIFMRCPE